jgi:hypothetical protein
VNPFTGPLSTLPPLRRLAGSGGGAPTPVDAARAGATGLALGFFGTGAIVFFPDGLMGVFGAAPLAATFLSLAFLAGFPDFLGDGLADGFADGLAFGLA